MSGKVTSTLQGKDFKFNMTADIRGEDSKAVVYVTKAQMVIIIKDGKNYLGDGKEDWIEIRDEIASEADSGFIDTENYIKFTNLINENQFEYLGVQDCDGSKCHVFKFTEGDNTSTVYFDGSSKLVKKLLISGKDSSGEFKVEFGNAAAIEAPANAEVLEGLESIGKMFQFMSPVLSEAGIDFGDLIEPYK